jgi:hypothetical protein
MWRTCRPTAIGVFGVAAPETRTDRRTCINHERVYRLMREHELLLRRPGMREIIHGMMIA